jgi:mannose-6-phosphate isomerase-like protein (cupin superfamily)
MQNCISYHFKIAYPRPQIHEDQEGFLVLEGIGWAKVGDQEFRIELETSFIVPAGVEHSIRRDKDSKSVKVFWLHESIA